MSIWERARLSPYTSQSSLKLTHKINYDPSPAPSWNKSHSFQSDWAPLVHMPTPEPITEKEDWIPILAHMN